MQDTPTRFTRLTHLLLLAALLSASAVEAGNWGVNVYVLPLGP